MQFERNRMYRVKAVADALDVSVATIYRAVESGALHALKIGTGTGTVRVPGAAVLAYLDACASSTQHGHPVVSSESGKTAANDGGDAA